jgi:signal-transduction protein with cAMP-binding, CBS, and nucleotidyltransferase domain
MQRPVLTTYRFPANTCIPQAQPKLKTHVSMDSSALDVMTDLAIVKAETIDPQTSLPKAERMMIDRGVRSLFVTSDFPCVEGLVTASDLTGSKVMQATSLRQAKHQDLCVADVMTELSKIDVIDYDELKNSYIDSVVAIFEQLQCTHLLVVQAAKVQGPARIRGVISVTQLERQLGQNVMAFSPDT